MGSSGYDISTKRNQVSFCGRAPPGGSIRNRRASSIRQLPKPGRFLPHAAQERCETRGGIFLILILAEGTKEGSPSQSRTRTPPRCFQRRKDKLRGAAWLEQVWSRLDLPGEKKSHLPGSLGLLATSPPHEKRALPWKLRREDAPPTTTPGVDAASHLAAPNTRVTDSDKWEAASGNILRSRRKLLEPGDRQESKAEHLTERGGPRDAEGRARWPGRAWTRQPAAAGGDPGSGKPLEPAQLSPPGTQRRTPGCAEEGAGIGGALTCGALRPGAGQRLQLQPQEQAEGERGEVRHPGGSGSAPSRGGWGRDWGGRGVAPHCRRGRRGARRWAPGAGAAALEAEARRELRREAGRGRDAGRGAVSPES
uniref:Uncharacterized protein n=1 Tax=Rangifer tarandus platyrhynchus TaxID=3082113 RepID=A0ACB0FIB1_RANTA|nr:unnamed protein product [Rangifer tarandus platyrhynchus]